MKFARNILLSKNTALMLALLWALLAGANYFLSHQKISGEAHNTETQNSEDEGKQDEVVLQQASVSTAQSFHFIKSAHDQAEIAEFEQETDPRVNLAKQFFVSQSKNFKILLEYIISTNAP